MLAIAGFDFFDHNYYFSAKLLFSVLHFETQFLFVTT
jgi:hypothetical protein